MLKLSSDLPSLPLLTSVELDPWEVSDKERASSDEFPRVHHDEWADTDSETEADPMTDPIAASAAFLDLIIGLNFDGALSVNMRWGMRSHRRVSDSSK